MKDRTYTLISNICIIVVVASALLFGRWPEWNWLLGMVAAVATLVSIGTYFYNLTHTNPQIARQNDNVGAADPAVATETSASPERPLVADRRFETLSDVIARNFDALEKGEIRAVELKTLIAYKIATDLIHELPAEQERRFQNLSTILHSRLALIAAGAGRSGYGMGKSVQMKEKGVPLVHHGREYVPDFSKVN